MSTPTFDLANQPESHNSTTFVLIRDEPSKHA